MTQNTNRQENDNNDSEDLGQSSSIDIMRKFQLLLTLMASPSTDLTGSRKSVLAGLFTIFMLGTVIGLITPKNEALTPPYQTVSAAIGYMYFMVSCYLLINFKLYESTGERNAMNCRYKIHTQKIDCIFFYFIVHSYDTQAWMWVKNIAVLNNSRIYPFKTLECQPS